MITIDRVIPTIQAGDRVRHIVHGITGTVISTTVKTDVVLGGRTVTKVYAEVAFTRRVPRMGRVISANLLQVVQD
jgi:hypothetical protein